MFYSLAASLNFAFKWLSIVLMFDQTLFARLATENFCVTSTMLNENVRSFSRGFRTHQLILRALTGRNTSRDTKSDDW